MVLPTAPVLAEPEGVCEDDDIAVTPAVQDPVAGQPVSIVLKLRTITAAACTWQVSAETMAVRISVADDEVWASRQCPGLSRRVRWSCAAQSRRPTSCAWSSRRSDEACSDLTEYAEPGDYRVTAAALGGEPDFVVFDLAAPQAPEAPAVPDADKLDLEKDKKGDKDKPSRRSGG